MKRGVRCQYRMGKRTQVPNSTQADVLVQSRRRCCVCFGLHRDESIRKGQIAHLDGNPNNNDIENLAFLCFDHHEEYDSQTSQSKGLSRLEIVRYREELYYHYGNWSSRIQRDELLNFLAFAVADLDSMADAAIKAAGTTVWYADNLAHEVLTTDEVDYCDADLYVPYLSTLDYYASWGWLTYSYEEREIPEELGSVLISVQRKPICDEIAKRILEMKNNEKDT